MHDAFLSLLSGGIDFPSPESPHQALGSRGEQHNILSPLSCRHRAVHLPSRGRSVSSHSYLPFRKSFRTLFDYVVTADFREIRLPSIRDIHLSSPIPGNKGSLLAVFLSLRSAPGTLRRILRPDHLFFSFTESFRIFLFYLALPGLSLCFQSFVFVFLYMEIRKQCPARNVFCH